jgi:hypothetical protein
VNFNLRHLNLSHNKLSFLLNYVIELGLINNDLTKLLLYKCELDDEQVLKLADCKRVEGLQSLDVGDNLLDVNFTLIARVLKEQCPFLAELLCENNRNLKNCANFQIVKPKRHMSNYLLRLDL